MRNCFLITIDKFLIIIHSTPHPGPSIYILGRPRTRRELANLVRYAELPAVTEKSFRKNETLCNYQGPLLAVKPIVLTNRRMTILIITRKALNVPFVNTIIIDPLPYSAKIRVDNSPVTLRGTSST